MRRLVAVAGEPAVLLLQLDDLDGTAALFGAVFFRVHPAPSGMREVKQKCTVTAHHHVGIGLASIWWTGSECMRHGYF